MKIPTRKIQSNISNVVENIQSKTKGNSHASKHYNKNEKALLTLRSDSDSQLYTLQELENKMSLLRSQEPQNQKNIKKLEGQIGTAKHRLEKIQGKIQQITLAQDILSGKNANTQDVRNALSDATESTSTSIDPSSNNVASHNDEQATNAHSEHSLNNHPDQVNTAESTKYAGANPFDDDTSATENVADTYKGNNPFDGDVDGDVDRNIDVDINADSIQSPQKHASEQSSAQSALDNYDENTESVNEYHGQNPFDTLDSTADDNIQNQNDNTAQEYTQLQTSMQSVNTQEKPDAIKDQNAKKKGLLSAFKFGSKSNVSKNAKKGDMQIDVDTLDLSKEISHNKSPGLGGDTENPTSMVARNARQAMDISSDKQSQHSKASKLKLQGIEASIKVSEAHKASTSNQVIMMQSMSDLLDLINQYGGSARDVTRSPIGMSQATEIANRYISAKQADVIEQAQSGSDIATGNTASQSKGNAILDKLSLFYNGAERHKQKAIIKELMDNKSDIDKALSSARDASTKIANVGIKKMSEGIENANLSLTKNGVILDKKGYIVDAKEDGKQVNAQDAQKAYKSELAYLAKTAVVEASTQKRNEFLYGSCNEMRMKIKREFSAGSLNNLISDSKDIDSYNSAMKKFNMQIAMYKNNIGVIAKSMDPNDKIGAKHVQDLYDALASDSMEYLSNFCSKHILHIAKTKSEGIKARSNSTVEQLGRLSGISNAAMDKVSEMHAQFRKSISEMGVSDAKARELNNISYKNEISQIKTIKSNINLSMVHKRKGYIGLFGRVMGDHWSGIKGLIRGNAVKISTLLPIGAVAVGAALLALGSGGIVPIALIAVGGTFFALNTGSRIYSESRKSKHMDKIIANFGNAIDKRLEQVTQMAAQAESSYNSAQDALISNGKESEQYKIANDAWRQLSFTPTSIADQFNAIQSSAKTDEEYDKGLQEEVEDTMHELKEYSADWDHEAFREQ